MTEQQIRDAKRKGDVKLLRKLREGVITAVVETPDHPETLDAPELDAPTEPQE